MEKKIRLNMSFITKGFYIFVGICCIFFALGLLGILLPDDEETQPSPPNNIWFQPQNNNPQEDLDTEDIILIICGIIFFGGGGVYVLYLTRKDAGEIILTPEGILIDTYITSGSISKDNFIDCNQVTTFGVKNLGIKLKEIEKYIESSNIHEFKFKKHKVIGQTLLRVCLYSTHVLPLNFVTGILGVEKIPEKLTDEEILKWNGKSFGYHLLIPGFWFSDIYKVCNIIKDHFKEITKDTQKSQKKVEIQKKVKEESLKEEEKEEYKKCPMCAEYVKKEAKICRFCRYSFEEKRFIN